MQKGMSFPAEAWKDRRALVGISEVHTVYSPSVVDFHHRGV